MRNDSATTRHLAIMWVGLMFASLSAYFAFAERFDGTWRAYTLRLLTPLVVLLMAMALVERHRSRRR